MATKQCSEDVSMKQMESFNKLIQRLWKLVWRFH